MFARSCLRRQGDAKHNRMKYAMLTLSILMALRASMDGQGLTKQGKVLVYYDTTDPSSLSTQRVQLSTHAIQSAYGGGFQIVPIRRSEGFTPGRVKGHVSAGFFGYFDPRPEREEATPAKVVLSWIVTPDGRVVEPRVFESTDKRIADYLISKISLRRFTPGRFHGNAVFTLWRDKYVFGWAPKPSRDSSLFKDGLGIR